MLKRLVGTREWDPTGESFWGVLSKLCARNHMTWEEARSVFGERLDRSITTEGGSDPDDSSNINIRHLRELTGWSDAQIRSGFSDHYKPYWMKGDSAARIQRSRGIRLCHSCARAGIHLTVHQFLDWKRCPIHETVLQSTCPKCKADMGHLLLRSDFPQRALCSSCQWGLWDQHREQEPLAGVPRLQFVSHYLDWLQQIESYFSDTSGTGRWLGTPTRYDQLAHVSALVEGPAFIPICFINAQRIKARRVHSVFKHTTESEKQFLYVGEQGKLDFGASAELQATTKYEMTHLDLMKFAIKSKYSELRKRHHVDAEHPGIREISSTNLIVQNGCYTTCWASALWLWRRCFDGAWKPEESWSRLREQTGLSQTVIGQLWRDAFTVFFRLEDTFDFDNKQQWAPRSLSRMWITEWLEHAYYGFAALSCHATDLQALNSNDLAVHLADIGALPLFAMVQADEMEYMVCLSVMEEPSYFERLQSKGFAGNDENMLNNFDVLKPLLDGVGLHPETKRRWRVDSVRIRAQLEKRKSK